MSSTKWQRNTPRLTAHFMQANILLNFITSAHWSKNLNNLCINTPQSISSLGMYEHILESVNWSHRSSVIFSFEELAASLCNCTMQQQKTNLCMDTELFQTTTKGAQLTTDWFPSATYNCSLSLPACFSEKAAYFMLLNTFSEG